MTIMEKSIVVREAALIQAPVDRVWDVFSRLDGWSQWDPGLSGLHFVRGAPWKRGSVAEFHVQRLGGRSLVRAEIIESDPPRKILWLGNRCGIYGQHSFVFEPEGEGTRATTAVVFSGPFLSLAYLVLPEERLRKTFKQWLAGLRTAAED